MNGTTTLLQLNELPQHPARVQLVLALYTALVQYMQQHGLQANVQAPAVVPMQEEMAVHGDFAGPAGPHEGEAAHEHPEDPEQDGDHGQDINIPMPNGILAYPHALEGAVPPGGAGTGCSIPG